MDTVRVTRASAGQREPLLDAGDFVNRRRPKRKVARSLSPELRAAANDETPRRRSRSARRNLPAPVLLPVAPLAVAPELVNMAVAPHVPRVHLSPFLETAATGWFNAAELTFDAHGLLNPALRYSAIVQTLPGHLMTDLGDLPQRHRQAALTAAADQRDAVWTASYNELRQTLINRCGISSRAAIRQLISMEKRGDARPTVFLRRLQSLIAGRNLNCDDVIREVFLDNLPDAVRPVLVAMPAATPLEQLAQTADTILESLPASHAVVNSIASSNAAVVTRSQTADPHIARLEQQIAQLTQQMSALAAKFSSNTAPSERTRSRSRGPWMPVERTDNRCYYHANFGERARKCGDTASGRRCEMADVPLATESDRRDRGRSRTRNVPARPAPLQSTANMIDVSQLSTLLGAMRSNFASQSEN